MFSVERNHGSVSDKLFPIDGIGIGFFMDGVLPRPIVIISIGIGLNQRNMAKDIFFDYVLGSQKTLCLSVLMSYLKDHI